MTKHFINTFSALLIASWLCSDNCMANPKDGVLRPSVEEFDHFLPDFLGNRPDLKCSKGCVFYQDPHITTKTHHNVNTVFTLLTVSFNSGLGAYDKAVVRDASGEIIGKSFKMISEL